MHSLNVVCKYNYSIFFEQFVNKLCTNGATGKIEQICQKNRPAVVDINYKKIAENRSCCKNRRIIV